MHDFILNVAFALVLFSFFFLGYFFGTLTELMSTKRFSEKIAWNIQNFNFFQDEEFFNAYIKIINEQVEHFYKNHWYYLVDWEAVGHGTSKLGRRIHEDSKPENRKGRYYD